MYSYLKGQVIGWQSPQSHRQLLTLEVNSIGYDLWVTARFVQTLPALGEVCQVFTHLQVRDDQWLLYGFGSAAERDLFRQLTSVSGIGSQLALGLLDTLPMPDLVQAIVSGNTRLLSQAPGVGKKTAERIALELKAKLSDWRDRSGLITQPSAGPVGAVLEEVEMTLLALGYSSQEVMQALRTVGQTQALAKQEDAGAWLREAIAWLSQQE
ncbi:Holliday junction branch migration protein RuvA [Lyngbya confervoides]|uniref:Holliday junction branch migration complex subunit RuvA n=1 Tax=Lyngbya confervoides BDU141951 TaxID=1574623 RepID=A0ABD4T8J7_9CYAN|nr:Holliday junction branch migration protein RuvA [Lyngbya confervoides]MCM1985134.1 Holliday junction branch migration protein RuvA [Lyngbya confervoides BDU141951]